MTKRQRILYVVNNMEFFLSHRLPHAIAAQEQGYDIHVATPQHALTREAINAGFTFHGIPLNRSHPSVREEVRTVAALARLYRTLRPDIVHHVTIKPVLYGSLVARLTGVPAVVNAVSGLGYVFIATGTVAVIRRQIVLGMYRLAFGHPNSRVIFQNPNDRSMFVDTGIVPYHRTVLIRGSGVDLNTFVPAEEPSGPVTVVLASRLLGDKGVREFVGAARQLHARGIKGRFVLVGDVDPGNPTSLTSSEIRSWEYDGTIEWWGHRDDMSQVFADCHLVCLPSYQEGLPKVLIEAAAAGRPIVTTDVPGCREVVQHGETGFLVPPRTVSPLASALEQLMLDQALRARFGARAREGSVQFDLQTVIADTLALYQTVAPGEPRVSD